MYLIKAETLTDIADAIREKTGATDAIAVSDMATAISGISDSTNTGDGSEDTLLSGSLSGAYENDRITGIRTGAFWGCKSLTSVSLPNVTGAGTAKLSYAFRECSALVSVSLPAYTSTLSGGSTFVACSNLKTVSVPNLSEGPLGSSSFTGCTSLTEISFADKVTSIGTNAFERCKGLVEVRFPIATQVAGYAFKECTSLVTADFHVVTGLYAQAFYKCSALTALILRGPTVVTLGGSNHISDTPIASGTGYIYVPASLIDAYKATSGWSTYAAQFRALEDYTVDGTTTGDLDPTKVAA